MLKYGKTPGLHRIICWVLSAAREIISDLAQIGASISADETFGWQSFARNFVTTEESALPRPRRFRRFRLKRGRSD